MNSSADDYCLNEAQLRMSFSPFEEFVIGKMVPLLIVFGVTGNLINLSVLLDTKMRSRSNTLLACLAVSDIFFLLFMIPHCMAHYTIFANWYYFRLIYLRNKMHLIAILNWTSACAIWLVLGVSLERLVAIMYPLHSRNRPQLLKPIRITVVIVVTTGILTFYNHFSYHCASKMFCRGTQPHAWCVHQDSNTWLRPNQTNPNPQWLRLIVRWFPIINAVLVVFLPIVLVCLSNILLILTIKKRKKHILKETTEQTKQRSVEQKVASTVILIVTSFTITQGPSAVFNVVAAFHPHIVSVDLSTLTTFFVILGKAITFVLFCTSSASFRQRLLHKTKLIRRETTRKLTGLTGEGSTVETCELMTARTYSQRMLSKRSVTD